MIVALVVGAVVGVAWHNTEAGPRSPALDPAAVTSTAPPELDAILVITSIRDEGSLIRLTWIDPTGGEASFVISQITDDGARPLRRVPAGQTETVISGLDPNARQYCFVVLAVSGSGNAVSAATCTPERSTT